jgi:DNA invertase Pin-like site-specific DNA recombinase
LRHLIRSRTSEGGVRAKARGVKFGRKPKLSRFQIEEAIARREAGESLADIGRTFGVSHSTIKKAKQFGKATIWNVVHRLGGNVATKPQWRQYQRSAGKTGL